MLSDVYVVIKWRVVAHDKEHARDQVRESLEVYSATITVTIIHGKSFLHRGSRFQAGGERLVVSSFLYGVPV